MLRSKMVLRTCSLRRFGFRVVFLVVRVQQRTVEPCAGTSTLLPPITPRWTGSTSKIFTWNQGGFPSSCLCFVSCFLPTTPFAPCRRARRSLPSSLPMITVSLHGTGVFRSDSVQRYRSSGFHDAPLDLYIRKELYAISSCQVARPRFEGFQASLEVPPRRHV